VTGVVNRAVEGVRAARRGARLLAERARRATRAPVVLVPSILGTALVDARGGSVWGTIRGLYLGPALDLRPAQPAGLLAGFTVVPGVWDYDVFGGLVRWLERVGGYRAGEDLQIFAYDWRAGVAEAAEALAEKVASLRGAGDERVDLVCVSTGGLVARRFLGAGAAAVRRVVYVGTPRRGSLTSVRCLFEGARLAPLGRTFAPREIATLQTVYDALPHPDDAFFVDEHGAPAPLDLYDPDVWRRLSVPTIEAERLARARATWLDGAAAPVVDSVVIGARHLETPARALAPGGAAPRLPDCAPRPRGEPHPFLFEPGDGSVTARSLGGGDATWWVTPSQHRELPADPAVHRLVLEALVATDRRIPGR
jgi:hypothetical protein